MHRLLTLSLCTFAVVAPLAGESWKPDSMPREAEIRAALAAGPPNLRAEAGVYVLGATGFELARESSNGFHCLVERSHPGAFEPQCFDAEGSRTLLRAVLLAAELRTSGKTSDEIERAVAAGYASGELRAPARPGINYMLSPENRVPIDREGTKIVPFRPHLMFYVPYLTDADLGSDGSPASPVFVVAPGRPGAYAIVPVPEDLAPHDGHP